MYVCIDMSDIILIGTPLSFNYLYMDINIFFDINCTKFA